MHGGSIGTRGEVLLGDGETIATVRYTVGVSKITGMEFTTSAGTTFGPFGWDEGNEIVVKVGPAIVFFSIIKTVVLFVIRLILHLGPSSGEV